LATGLAAFTHVQAFGGAPLSPWGLGTLLLAFGLTAGALLALVLRVQQELSVGHPLRGALGDRLPRWGRWLLGLGFVYLGLQLLDVMPGGGGRGAGFSFDRTFSAILAWQALAAALFHQGGWIRSQGSRQGPEA
jgi:hypothetical protein